MKGVGCLNSQRTTLHHWLILSGRSRCERIQLANTGYITVSDVGRTAMGSSSSEFPDLVTHATWQHPPRSTLSTMAMDVLPTWYSWPTSLVLGSTASVLPREKRFFYAVVFNVRKKG